MPLKLDLNPILAKLMLANVGYFICLQGDSSRREDDFLSNLLFIALIRMSDIFLVCSRLGIRKCPFVYC